MGRPSKKSKRLKPKNMRAERKLFEWNKLENVEKRKKYFKDLDEKLNEWKKIKDKEKK